MRNDIAPLDSLRGDIWLLATVCFVTSLIMLDSNIVAVALPAIREALNSSYEGLQWIIGAYALAYSSLLMAAGSFGDLYGRRLAMVTGLAIFALASLGCGLALSSTMLDVWRVIQGVGGALLLTASMAVLSARYTGPKRTKALALWGASIGIAMAGGPIVGGVITHFLGWRWVFLINPPTCLILIIASLHYVDESKDPNAHRVDFAGMLTLSGSLALLIWALISGNEKGWESPEILWCLAGFVVLAVGFIVAERMQARPMVDFGLFQHSTFLGSVFAMIGYGASAQVLIFLLPLFIQTTYGFEPLYAGVAMIPFALPMVMAPRFATKLASIYSGRSLLTAGLIVVCVGNLLMATLAHAQTGYSSFAGGMLVTGCGAGLLNGLTIKVLQSAVPRDRAGMASGLASTTRYIGILISIAGLGAVASAATRTSLREALVALGVTGDMASKIADHVSTGDIAGAVALAPSVAAAGVSAYAAGFIVATLTTAVVAAVAALLSYCFIRPEETAPEGDHPDIRCGYVDCRHPV